MNSLQNLGANYGQQPIGSLGGNLPSNPAERDMNLDATNSLPPAFRSGATSIQAQQALAQRLQQAGYRFDDAKLNEIQRLSDEQKLEREQGIYMGAGLFSMAAGGDKLYDFGERSMQRTGQFVKQKFLKDSWLDNFDNMGEKTSLRQAGLQRGTNGLELLDPENTRSGWQKFWDRNRSGIRAMNHAEYIEAAKELKLQQLKGANLHLPDEVIRNMPESAVTGVGKFGKQVKQAISPVTDAVGNLAKDVFKFGPSDPLPDIESMEVRKVERFNSQTTSMIKEPPAPTAGFFNFKEMGNDWDNNKWKFAKGVGGKALGVAGIGLTVYAAGSNAMDNYKNKNYRAIATDLTGEAVGVVVSSVATGAVNVALCAAGAAAVVACPPLALLAPVAGFAGMMVSGVIGGVIGQGATNITKWAVDPFFKLFGLKNADDNHRDKIKENRELLTNIAVGTGSALGNALKSVPRQATISSGNPSMFANNPATATNAPMIKGALDF